MKILLHSLSGSPFGWKVQWALEHFALSYDVKLLSPDKGDTRTSQFLALNPHGKLPVLQIGGLTLYESEAILAYLEDAYASKDLSLWPITLAGRAMARRISIEVSAYLYPSVRALVMECLGKTQASSDLSAVAASIARITPLLAMFAATLKDGFILNSKPGGADYALYPLVALLQRITLKNPASVTELRLSSELEMWALRMESLPAYPRTYPPHWRS